MAEKDEYSPSADLIPAESNSNDEKVNLGGEKISGKAWGRVWFKFLRLPFPVFFIVWNEFCERFSYYGMRAVLTLFLKTFLNFEDDTATAIYHGFIVMCYLTPVGGAIISDSCLGKYGTIVSLSVVYAVGNVLMSLSAIPFNDSRGLNIGLTMLSLLIIAVGTGGIKPCVAAFGGDQFVKDKIDLLPVFFSVFYFSINAGSVLSTILTPILRSYVSCFDQDTCFPLAFGVPAGLMIVSLAVFIFGTKWYLINRPKKDAAFLFFRVPFSIVYAIYRRVTLGKVTGIRNFMDYAAPRFPKSFVFDVYLFLRVLVMLLPLPVFWALFDQQGSRWTLQALRMNGRLGKFVIEPDQVQVLNPVFIIILIPVFEVLIYPLFHRCHLLRKPLQRMVVGMYLAGLAFCMAAGLEIFIQQSSNELNKGESRVVITNSLSEPVMVRYGNRDSVNISNSIKFDTTDLGLTNVTLFSTDGTEVTRQLSVTEKQINQLFVVRNDISEYDIVWEVENEFFPDGDKASVGLFIANIDTIVSGSFNFSLCEADPCKSISDGKLIKEDLSSNSGYFNATELTIGKYHYLLEASDIRLDGMLSTELDSGGIYTTIIQLNTTGDGVDVRISGANSPNSVSVFLQVPMYITITAGEVLFSITGLEFAYSQAPPSMKSLSQAAWLLTVAFGNLVVVIVAESSLFSNQAYEFFFFAAAIIAVSCLFAFMSCFYKYIDPAKLITTRSGRGYDEPQIDESNDTSIAENNTLLSDSSPEENPLSDIETDGQSSMRRTTITPDESKL